jgi:CRP-like cAMP-binding protein
VQNCTPARLAKQPQQRGVDRRGRERDKFPLTQEFVAMMLGASRPTVTLVAGTLQKAGLITYHHGQLTIVDRKKLESASWRVLPHHY